MSLLLERKTFKALLTKDQVYALEKYYNEKEKMPRRLAKLQLAKQYNMDPILLNRWFQSRRNKEKTILKKQKNQKENAKSVSAIENARI